MSDESDEATSLFLRARQGSEQAINAVFERYGGRLHALIRLRLGPQLRRRLESRDVLQSTMLKAFQGIERFGGSSSGSLMAWLGAIAHAEICDQADFHGRQKRDVARDTGVDERAIGIEARVKTEVSRIQLAADSERLERAIEKLSEPRREVVLLRSFEELSFPEVGERMGKSPDACRMLYARALTDLTLEMRQNP